MHSASDYLKLHIIILLFGFTGILGMLVTLPALDMVFYRTLMAAAGMGAVLVATQENIKVSSADFIKLMLTGFIVGAHWLTFFISARVSNVSISLVGFATASLWTAFLEPLVKGYKIRAMEVLFGLTVLMGLYIIYASNFGYSEGLILGVLSGLTCAAFSIINSLLVKRVSSRCITFYEMMGACLLTALFFPVYQYFWANGPLLPMLPQGVDWIYLLILGGLCTVYAYSAAVELMRKVSVFFFQLTLNLEPVYGIVMAVLVFGETEKMNTNFYVGTLIIFLAVLLFPWMRKRFTIVQTKSTHP